MLYELFENLFVFLIGDLQEIKKLENRIDVSARVTLENLIQVVGNLGRQLIQRGPLIETQCIVDQVRNDRVHKFCRFLQKRNACLEQLLPIWIIDLINQIEGKVIESLVFSVLG